MNDKSLINDVLAISTSPAIGTMKRVGTALVVVGVIGLGFGFFIADTDVGWTALLSATVIVLGVAMVGPLISAIFQMTGSKWGRAYRRLAEGSVAFMPIGLVGLLVLMVAGDHYLPWVHEHPHVGGKAVWLTRGFWDIRVLGLLLVTYAVGLRYVRLSLRRDFCVQEVRDTFRGALGKMLSKNIKNPDEEAKRCSKKMARFAPIVAIVYGVAFTILGIDLIMALEPDWFSTLFGAWYFIGNVFCGLALIAMFQIAMARDAKFRRFFGSKRQADFATLLLAFCLINVDFFWNQYLTIWYANLPEETFYLIERTTDTKLPWRSLSFVSLVAFFVIPFFALLLRRVKTNGPVLSIIAVLAVIGVLLARFIEIAPPILKLESPTELRVLALPLSATALIFLGFLGVGLLVLSKWATGVPLMALNDRIFLLEMGGEEHGG